MSSERPVVFVVTPVHNGIDHTSKFLLSLTKQTYDNLKVVIVDDGSIDGTSARISADFPEVVLLSGDGNLWWSGATNVGAKHALANGADYIFTVNNDVELDPSAIATSVAIAEEQTDALVGSVIYHDTDHSTVWYAGGAFDQEQGELVHLRKIESRPTMESDWLTGMGVLVPSSVYSKIGLYDAHHFPQYFGDADFSIRSKRAGFSLLVSTQSKIYADVQSAWISKDFTKKPLSFLLQVFFSIRSQYYIPARIAFYRRYWPGNYVFALFKLYAWVWSKRIVPFLRSKVKRALQKIGIYPGA